MPSVCAYQARRDFEALRIHSNDWILLRPEPAPPDHTVVLCQYQGEVLVGTYRVTESGPALELPNASKPASIRQHDDFRILGAVVGTRRGPKFPDLRLGHVR